MKRLWGFPILLGGLLMLKNRRRMAERQGEYPPLMTVKSNEVAIVLAGAFFVLFGLLLLLGVID